MIGNTNATMTSIAELTKDNNCLKQIVKDLKAQLALTQHDLKLANRDLEKYADEYAGLVAEKDEEIAKLTATIDAQQYEDMTIREEHDRFQKEIEEWKQADKKREKSKARKPKTETLNFDDANYAFYWAAQDGDVIFWKVPCALMDLTNEEDDEGSRVVEAFQGCRFGEEWGSLSSHTIRTMTLEILEENE
jgi:hypothetical protein